MTYNPDRHHRRSIRLKGYDYTKAGAYFVTVCVQDRECLFGGIVNGVMELGDAGQMIKKRWLELNHKFPSVETDEFVIMPNHVHGIIIIVDQSVGADLRVRPGNPATRREPVGRTESGAHTGAPLPGMVQWFKTMTTNKYILGVQKFGWPMFRGRLWQRNYFEHVIRDSSALDRIRQYIAENPSRWDCDRENPLAVSPEPTSFLSF